MKNVQIRLNERRYDESVFLNGGIEHIDLQVVTIRTSVSRSLRPSVPRSLRPSVPSSLRPSVPLSPPSPNPPPFTRCAGNPLSSAAPAGKLSTLLYITGDSDG